MKFQKYPSLVNSVEIARGKWNKFTDIMSGEFYATEKIHGTNFGIHYDGNEIKFAKRTSFIEDGELFFKHEEFFDTYDTQYIKDYFNTNCYKRVIFFGEFYGGTIQPMEYRETLEGTKNFRIFNVMGENSDGTYDVLGYEEMLSVVGSERLAPYETKGTIWELLKELDLEQESQLGGYSEGYVLQPYKSRTFIPNQNNIPFFGIKHKTERFSEVKPEKLHNLVGTAAKLFDLQRYVTEPRYWNLVSKGDIEPSIANVGILIDAFIDDIFEEYVGTLTEDEKVQYRNRLKAPVAQVIYRNIVKPE